MGPVGTLLPGDMKCHSLEPLVEFRGPVSTQKAAEPSRS